MVSPSTDKPMDNLALPSSVGVLVEGYNSENSPIGGYGALGIFHGIVNPSSLTGELNSLRSSAIDDALEMVDLTNFLSLAPCTNCVKMKGIELDADGHVVVKIGIKHPFPPETHSNR